MTPASVSRKEMEAPPHVGRSRCVVQNEGGGAVLKLYMLIRRLALVGSHMKQAFLRAQLGVHCTKGN
jgi:hypothetical protein